MPEDHRKEISIPSSPTAALERHYTIGELSELWQLDEKTVRKLFEQEPDVLSFGAEETRHKRRYISLRIPESALLRVHHRMTKAS